MFTSRHRYDEYYWYLQHRRRRRALLAGIVLALGWGLLAWHDAPARPAHGRTEHRAHRTPAPAASPPASSARATEAAAGQGLTWSGFHGILLPASAQAGPRHVDGGLAWGFADTPRGALLAAVNIGVRTAALWGPRIYGPTITRQVTGQYAAALLDGDNADYAQMRAAAHVGAGLPAGRGYAAEVGYRFVSWAPHAAAIDVITSAPGSGGTAVLAATQIEVVWQRGDWRLIAPSGGDWSRTASAVSSLVSYTPFPDKG
jgi:hypothetical protein